jgi:hypothetical protein
VLISTRKGLKSQLIIVDLFRSLEQLLIPLVDSRHTLSRVNSFALVLSILLYLVPL